MDKGKFVSGGDKTPVLKSKVVFSETDFSRMELRLAPENILYKNITSRILSLSKLCFMSWCSILMN